jgi:hypothetical protein
MQRSVRLSVVTLPLLTAGLLACPQQPTVVTAPVAVQPAASPIIGWPGYAHDPSHNAQSLVAAQPLNRILWSTPVDLQPQYSGADLLIHYGTTLITPAGTVLVTVKTGASGGFQMEGRRPTNGALLWTMVSDYVLPPHNWTPSCGSALTPQNKVAMPASGGTVLLRGTPDLATGTTTRLAFYGLANYTANQAALDSTVTIDTPITSDRAGNLFFGFRASGSAPLGLVSGLARISAAGVGTWVSAATAANDAAMRKVAYNCAPALSQDGSAVYVGINNTNNSGFGVGYLVKLDSTTLATLATIRLKDVVNPANDAYLADDGTATPMVGPDGDVYYGVLENPFGYNDLRGFMLHFDGALTLTKTPGAFGWDDTASVVPASCVPSYHGTSTYLLLTKYNNYGGTAHGTGLNKLGVLDPNATMTDPVSGGTTMAEVLTILGPSPDPNYPGGVREWCINTAAIDVLHHCAIVNNEDGKVYRWDFNTNTLSQVVTLTAGIGEAYTPTILGPNGVAYAINNATLYAVGR